MSYRTSISNSPRQEFIPMNIGTATPPQTLASNLQRGIRFYRPPLSHEAMVNNTLSKKLPAQ